MSEITVNSDNGIQATVVTGQTLQASVIQAASNVYSVSGALAGPKGDSGTNGTNGIGVPAGGTTGQVLAKTSNTDYATGWVAQSGGSTVTDATTTVKGIIQLAGDLGGTAAAPTVTKTYTKTDVGLGNVDNTSDVNKPVSTAQAASIATKATDTAVVHNTGAETIAGIKTFSSAPVVPSNSFPESAITNLTTDLAAKQPTISLTTTGTSGAATLVSNTLNIPQYSAGGGGDASTNTAVSVDGEVVLFSGTAGKTLKRATGTGIPKLTSGVQGIAVSGTDYAPGTAGNATGIVKSTTTTGALTTAVAADFPTLNQSTTGNAATVTTNANLTGPITSTGNATVVASQTGTGSKFVMDTSPTLVTPTIGAATATSVNKVAITAPATSATLAIANLGTLATAGSFSITLTATAATSVTLPTTGTLATLAGTETLTNKTLTAPVISTITNTGTVTLPTATDTLVGRATTDTLTNKTISGASNTISGISQSMLGLTPTSYTNPGSAGGSFWYMNLGGIKMFWGATANTIGSTTGGANGVITFPSGFFTTIQQGQATVGPNNTTNDQRVNWAGGALNTTSCQVNVLSAATTSAEAVQVFVIGT